MSFYQTFTKIGSKYIGLHKLFKYGFNFSPMYRRSTGRITYVSKDLHSVKIKIPISYKNKNYVNSIFGGSLFSAVDPIPMVQLINILGNQYVVWDKTAEIKFKKPAKQDVYAQFEFTKEEIQDIIQKVKDNKEIEILKTILIQDITKTSVFCEVNKNIYIADKKYFKSKKLNKR